MEQAKLGAKLNVSRGAVAKVDKSTGAPVPSLCPITENGLRRVPNPWYNKL